MSGRKNTLVNQLVNPANSTTTFSLSTSFTSPPTVVRFLDNCSYQINVTTTDSQGTFQIQASDDYYVNEANDSVVSDTGNWVPLTLNGGTPVVSAANTNIIVNLNQLPFYAIRVAYISSTAGTGTCQIFVTDKALG